MSTMTGRRIYRNEEGHLIYQQGDYAKDEGGVWWARVPAPGFPVGMLTDHEITEHEDGTISVEPSILVEGQFGKQWHGYLRHGVWTQAEY